MPIVNVQTRIGDIFSNPYDQVREQLRVRRGREGAAGKRTVQQCGLWAAEQRAGFAESLDPQRCAYAGRS